MTKEINDNNLKRASGGNSIDDPRIIKKFGYTVHDYYEDASNCPSFKEEEYTPPEPFASSHYELPKFCGYCTYSAYCVEDEKNIVYCLLRIP